MLGWVRLEVTDSKASEEGSPWEPQHHFCEFESRGGRPARCQLSQKALILFVGWCILFVLCWPLALLALVLFSGRLACVVASTPAGHQLMRLSHSLLSIQ